MSSFGIGVASQSAKGTLAEGCRMSEDVGPYACHAADHPSWTLLSGRGWGGSGF